jgi:uncharacterized membrane protein (UPF0127 family)
LRVAAAALAFHANFPHYGVRSNSDGSSGLAGTLVMSSVYRAQAATLIHSALLFCLLAAFSVSPCAAEPRLEPLEIVTSTGTHSLEVELANTSGERAKGLMNRQTLPEGRGMLFDFHVEDAVLMWMKNTYIPLDMIFVSRKGRVVSIARDATPMSETIISSGKPAYAVIEVNAGVANRLGVAVGDVVRHPIFQKENKGRGL